MFSGCSLKGVEIDININFNTHAHGYIKTNLTVLN